MKRLIGSALGLVLLIIACSKSSDDQNNSGTIDCNGVTSTFSTNVSPLIASSCATNSDCHGSGSTNGPGALLTYQQIFSARVNIRQAVVNGVMPKNSSLSASQKATIVCWIDAGAANN